MTNEIGKTLFSKAGELGVPVGFMCMKVLWSFLLMCMLKLSGFIYLLDFIRPGLFSSNP